MKLKIFPSVEKKCLKVFEFQTYFEQVVQWSNDRYLQIYFTLDV